MTKHSNLTPEAFAARLTAAHKAVEDAADRLASAAAGRHRSDDLLDLVAAVARAEVVYSRESLAAAIAERQNVPPAEAIRLSAADAISTLVHTGPDDTWSGRGNDLRRVRHDALRRWVADNADLGDD